MTYDELVEKVARAMKPTTSSIVDRLIEIGADRLEAIQLLPLQEATVAIATIREALIQSFSKEMERTARDYTGAYYNQGMWQAMLAASPLGEKKG